MTEGSLLRDLVVLFATALPIVVVFQRLHLPSVVGFIIAGVVIGPHGVGLIGQSAEVDSLAELGLVMLLFVVGLELSFAELGKLGRLIVWSGSLQVVITAAVVSGLALAAGTTVPQAVFLGFLVAHSSTAIVLKLLADRHEIDAPHGRAALGILLIQDLCLVPMVLLTRVLASPEQQSVAAVALVLAKATGAVVVIVVTARLLMPRVLRQIVRLRSRELFTGTIVVLSLGTAWLAAQFGLSLALGALIAGLVISESEYSHQVVAEILPFRDTFNSVFFISIGMLVHVGFFATHFTALIAAAAAVLILKLVIAVGAMLPFYRSLRISWLTGLSLAGLGELSFVLLRIGVPAGLLSERQYETFVTVAVLTMLAAPFLITAAPAMAAGLASRFVGTAQHALEAGHGAAPTTHVLIVGYGLNGENLAHVLRETGVSYSILELDPERVATARARQEPVRYGDATRPDVLVQAGAAAAAVIVVAISDATATRHIVALVRQLNATVPIVVRTRYVAEIDELRRLGATEVIPEEFETSVEIFARVLHRLRVPRNIIGLQIDLIRQQGYSMLRGLDLPRQTLDQLGDILAATTTESFLVRRTASAAGSTLRDLRLRKTTGATVIAVVRDGAPLTNPDPDFEIRGGDILVMLGSHAQIDQAIALLDGAQ